MKLFLRPVEKAPQKIPSLSAHVMRLEKQLDKVGNGKRGRAKKQSLLGQISFFRQNLQELGASDESLKRTLKH